MLLKQILADLVLKLVLVLVLVLLTMCPGLPAVFASHIGLTFLHLHFLQRPKFSDG